MTSGLYKYIVFEPIEFDGQGIRLAVPSPARERGRSPELRLGRSASLVPLYYGRVEGRGRAMTVLVTGAGFIGSHVVDRLLAMSLGSSTSSRPRTTAPASRPP